MYDNVTSHQREKKIALMYNKYKAKAMVTDLNTHFVNLSCNFKCMLLYVPHALLPWQITININNPQVEI